MSVDASATASTADLLLHVRRCRRRLIWVSFVRFAWLSVATGMALAAAAPLIFDSSVSGWPSLATGALVGAAFAAGAASVRAPTLRSAAAAIDERLGLSDRVIAAFTLRERSEPIATLIVNGTTERLAGFVPARAFPIAFDRRSACAAVVMTASLLLGTMTPREKSPEQFDGRRASGVDLSESQGAGKPSGAHRPSAPTGATQVDASRGSRATPSASRTGEPPSVGGARGLAPRSDGNDSVTPPVPSASLAPQTARASASGPGRSENQASPATGEARGLGSTDGSGVGRSPGRGSATGQGGQPREGAGASGGLSAPSDARAGGVQGGRLGARPTAAALNAGTGPGPSPAGAMTAVGVETALTRDEVPPQWRAYVRDYLASIRDREQP